MTTASPDSTALVAGEDVLLTFKEAMNFLRVSRSTLYRLMWDGELTGHKVGSTWRFYRSDLRACVRSGQTAIANGSAPEPAALPR